MDIEQAATWAASEHWGDGLDLLDAIVVLGLVAEALFWDDEHAASGALRVAGGAQLGLGEAERW